MRAAFVRIFPAGSLPAPEPACWLLFLDVTGGGQAGVSRTFYYLTIPPTHRTPFECRAYVPRANSTRASRRKASRKAALRAARPSRQQTRAGTAALLLCQCDHETVADIPIGAAFLSSVSDTPPVHFGRRHARQWSRRALRVPHLQTPTTPTPARRQSASNRPPPPLMRRSPHALQRRPGRRLQCRQQQPRWSRCRWRRERCQTRDFVRVQFRTGSPPRFRSLRERSHVVRAFSSSNGRGLT